MTAERVAAWATGVGIGLMALMLTWLLGSRLAALVWEAPVGPVVAILAATVVGTAVAGLAGRRLAASISRGEL
jgi:hypothetical protein